MYRPLLAIAFLFFFALSAQAQTDEELKNIKAEKEEKLGELEAQVAELKGEIASIKKQLQVFPRWETGAFGILGANLNGFNDWFAREQPNSTAFGVTFSANAFANYFTQKSFWRNAGNLNVGFTRLQEKDRDGNTLEETELKSPDVINFTSLYGYKLSEKLAISVLGEYRSTFLENFNNPGYLDLGTGITWTPINNLVVVAHPLNYNFVFAEEGSTFESSLGAKIMADYTREILTGVNWKSNLSYFLSYEDSDFSNWTWINGIAFQAAKSIGVGLELGLRSNKQEAIAREVPDNPLQIYYVVGVTYSL